MAEPPAKRLRQDEGSSRRDRDYTASPRSPRPHDSQREDKGRSRYDDSRTTRRDDDKRRHSRSPRRDRKYERSRSRDRTQRDRDRREVNGHRRDRSRSHDRDRHRSTRDRDHQSARHERRRSRSRSPAKADDRSFRNRSPIKPTRSDHERPRVRDGNPKAEPEEKPRVKAEEKKPDVNGDAMAVDEDDEDVALRRLMGFTSFKSTQNTKVPGNNIYGVRREKKTEYRQYMNRVGGFNRPLSPSR